MDPIKLTAIVLAGLIGLAVLCFLPSGGKQGPIELNPNQTQTEKYVRRDNAASPAEAREFVDQYMQRTRDQLDSF